MNLHGTSKLFHKKDEIAVHFSDTLASFNISKQNS